METANEKPSKLTKQIQVSQSIKIYIEFIFSGSQLD